jgi:hypothetical protein
MIFARYLRIKAVLLALLAGLAVSACSQSVDNKRVRADIIVDAKKPYALGAFPLDPASAYLRAATAQGLVTFDRKGRIIPALASRWIITDDGMSYIFRLTKTTWNDGEEVTAKDVAAALQSRIGILSATQFGQDFDAIDKVVSMTGKVVEIRLRAPMPNLLELLAQPEMGIIHRNIGSGPMRGNLLGDVMYLQLRSTDKKGKPILLEERVALNRSTAALALARFNRRDTDMITGGKFQHLPLLNAANISDAAPQFDPVIGLFGLLLVNNSAFLSDVKNREAIASAIDRPRMLALFDNATWVESFTIIPELMPARAPLPRPDWASQTIAERHANGRVTIASWIRANGPVQPLRVAMPEGAGSRILFARLSADLAAIGVRVIMVAEGDGADLRLIDRVADKSSPDWFIEQLSCGQTPVCDAEADALLLSARTASGSDSKAILGQAEAKLQAARNYIPIAGPIRWSIAHDGLLGHSISPREWHFLQYLGQAPK